MKSKGDAQERMTTKINNEEYLTAAEAAKFLGVSAATFTKFQTVYHLGYMTRPGMGRRKYFKKKDLEPLMQFQPGTVEHQHNGK